MKNRNFIKQKFKILCLLIFLALAFIVSVYVFEGSTYFRMGWNAGADRVKAENAGKDAFESYAINVIPSDLTKFPDSVFNQKQHVWTPSIHDKLFVKAPVYTHSYLRTLLTVSEIMFVGIIILIISVFIKFIININKNIVFDKKNVSILRRIGIYHLLGVFFNFMSTYTDFRIIKKIIAIPDYEIKLNGAVESGMLIIGLIALLMAEVFAIGIKLQEEQDLTV